jgi:putative cell wall-binding protein
MGRTRHRRGRTRGKFPLAVLVAGLLVAGLAAPVGADSSQPRFLGTWGSEGNGDGEFDVPVAVAVGPGGTVYVTEQNNHRVQMFDLRGTFRGTWGSFGSGDGQFNTPTGVAVAPDGTVYVTDRENDRIQYFTPTGGFLGKWGGSGPEDGKFNSPRGVAVAADGTVYVVDHGNNQRLQYFTATGGFIGKWGGSIGNDPGQFNGLQDVAVAPDGTVYTSESNNGRIQYFTATGAFLGQWSGGSWPNGVAVAPDGTVYNVELTVHRVRRFTATGAPLSTWGSLGSGDGQFNTPAHLAVAPDGTVYVVDALNHRIQHFGFPSVTRLAGPNRFATAAAISQHHHPMPQAVDTVVVATGANFPDALAGAVAAAATQSPLLLTGSLPPATQAELSRLDPSNITILGGTAAVSAATAAALGGFGTTERLSGANRYETAIAISKHVFGDGEADVVVIATGENFPDALAAAPLAAALGGPVLLTPSTTLPQAVADEIARLGPSQIFVTGGPAAVSDAVVGQLSALASTTRVSGPNRYATAVAISKIAFPGGAGVVYVAVGTNFPDALAGAAQAAFWGGPVLLTPTDSLPVDVAIEIGRLDPHTIIILGGEAVVSAAVQAQLKAILGI